MGLAGLDIVDQVIGAVADTTSSNFGQEEGAMLHLHFALWRPVPPAPAASASGGLVRLCGGVAYIISNF